MNTYLCFWVCVITVTSVFIDVIDGDVHKDKQTLTRKRRTVNFTEFAVIAGGNALRKFMNTLTEIISYRNLYRQFEKPGTYDDAVKDFENLYPQNVKTLKLPGGVEGKMGDVYDKVVLIRSNSELGKPMMTIGHRDQKLDRIVYTGD